MRSGLTSNSSSVSPDEDDVDDVFDDVVVDDVVVDDVVDDVVDVSSVFSCDPSKRRHKDSKERRSSASQSRFTSGTRREGGRERMASRRDKEEALCIATNFEGNCQTAFICAMKG